MASSGLLSVITLPNGSSYDLRDNKAGHYLGTSTTAITEGAIGSGAITISGSNYYLNPTSGQAGLRDQDIVTYNGLIYLASITGTSGSASGTWVKLTSAATITDATIDGTTILDGTVAKIATTGSYDGDSTGANYNPLATKDYVDTAVQDLPQAMIFRGSLGTGGTETTLPTASESTVGDVYKVITAGTYASQAAKVGDLFIGTEVAGDPSTYTWTLIPSGDEPSGTVTSVGVATGTGGAAKGLKTGVGTNGTDPITASGTLSLDFASGFDTNSSVASATRSSTTGREYGLELDSNGKLAVNVPWTDTTYTFDANHAYDASTNPAATVGTVTGAIAALDGSITGTAGANQTITALSQTDGVVSATFSDISITVNQVSDVTATTTIHNPTAVTVVTDMSVAEPSSTAATGALTYYAYDSATETLTLKQIVETTGNSITTSDVSNVVVKTSQST